MTTSPRLLSPLRCLWDAAATLGEGTCWSEREQALYWVDILGHTLYRCDANGGERRQWHFDETVSAVAERQDRPGLAVALRRGLALFDPDSGRLERLHQPEPERTGNRFNDGKCDPAGRFWAGSMDFDCRAPTGALYCYGADGRAVRAADLGWAVTNGPTWSLDGRTLYVNHTVERAVWAFDVDPGSGRITRPRLWLRFDPDDGYPDGMTTDAEGRLWIAHWGAACVSCHDPDTAAELLRVPLPASHITNVAFGGAALRTLFITSARFGLDPAQLAAEPQAGALFAIDTDTTGLPANAFAG
ncbi:SMP-30/gluconolactonase/LRE family protein [Aquincola sp. S2]|uniref:SMP-30/gluconolactonase/LRE family protein n=1 Tax=Pseudaquabacterium terrae TaxID=2732868 RepID=A0ABX2ER70_9BURK|nr:SMP-30/gluconolactonase/LRE family protein [Aquabacterium terrae]NRF71136.1 SMP-30/gluconolactonase/LRE family protein [Aquabacterium terrae]